MNSLLRWIVALAQFFYMQYYMQYLKCWYILRTFCSIVVKLRLGLQCVYLNYYAAID